GRLAPKCAADGQGLTVEYPALPGVDGSHCVISTRPSPSDVRRTALRSPRQSCSPFGEFCMIQRCFVRVVLLSVVSLSMMSGGADPRNRKEIIGNVKYKGQPVADGLVIFTPLEGQATGDGAQIIKGKYLIPREKGLSPGKYRVAIYAGNGTSGAGDATPESPYAGKRVPRERLPPALNEQSVIVKDIANDGLNQFDFDIP